MISKTKRRMIGRMITLKIKFCLTSHRQKNKNSVI